MYKVFLMLLTMILSSAVLSQTVVTQEIVGDGYLVEKEVNCKDKKIGSVEYKNCKSTTKTSKIPKAIIVEEPAPKAIIVEEEAPKATFVKEEAVLKAIPVTEKKSIRERIRNAFMKKSKKSEFDVKSDCVDCFTEIPKVPSTAADCDGIDKAKFASEHRSCVKMVEAVKKEESDAKLSDCDGIDKTKYPTEHKSCLKMIVEIQASEIDPDAEPIAKPSDCDSLDKTRYPSEHNRCMALTEEINKIPKAIVVSEEVSSECTMIKFQEVSCPEGTYTFTSGKSGASIQDGLRKTKENVDDQERSLPSRSTGSTSK